MIKHIQTLFKSQQAKIFCILSLSTAFCITMVAFRMHYAEVNLSELSSPRSIAKSRGITFFFLIWNLFLAWVPYWVAISLKGFYKLSQSKILISGLLVTWLLFFPNAPYILTDLLHLHNRQPIPHWYDLMLFVSFAWTGLLLGLISLHEVRVFIRDIYSETLSWLFVLGSTILCGFGVYLGRCLRWNSWDILTKPSLLFQDIFSSLHDGMALKITLVFSIFLLLGYLTLNILMDKSK